LKREGKAWIELDIPCDEVNLNLFHACINRWSLTNGPQGLGIISPTHSIASAPNPRKNNPTPT
jgi:hypothetical protein